MSINLKELKIPCPYTGKIISKEEAAKMKEKLSGVSSPKISKLTNAEYERLQESFSKMESYVQNHPDNIQARKYLAAIKNLVAQIGKPIS